MKILNPDNVNLHRDNWTLLISFDPAVERVKNEQVEIYTRPTDDTIFYEFVTVRHGLLPFGLFTVSPVCRTYAVKNKTGIKTETLQSDTVYQIDASLYCGDSLRKRKTIFSKTWQPVDFNITILWYSGMKKCGCAINGYSVDDMPIFGGGTLGNLVTQTEMHDCKCNTRVLPIFFGRNINEK